MCCNYNHFYIIFLTLNMLYWTFRFITYAFVLNICLNAILFSEINRSFYVSTGLLLIPSILINLFNNYIDQSNLNTWSLCKFVELFHLIHIICDCWHITNFDQISYYYLIVIFYGLIHANMIAIYYYLVNITD
jgi:hypothetical protein